MGHADSVIGAVPDLVVEYPLSEPLECLFIRALHAAGRDAEALARYTVIRQRLADELGTDPGPALQALHAAILRGELPLPAMAELASGRPPATPAQLPPDVSGFAGRDEELRRLDHMIRGGFAGRPDRIGVRHGRRGEDDPRGALGLSCTRPVPRRATVCEPAGF